MDFQEVLNCIAKDDFNSFTSMVKDEFSKRLADRKEEIAKEIGKGISK